MDQLLRFGHFTGRKRQAFYSDRNGINDQRDRGPRIENDAGKKSAKTPVAIPASSCQAWPARLRPFDDLDRTVFLASELEYLGIVKASTISFRGKPTAAPIRDRYPLELTRGLPPCLAATVDWRGCPATPEPGCLPPRGRHRPSRPWRSFKQRWGAAIAAPTSSVLSKASTRSEAATTAGS